MLTSTEIILDATIFLWYCLGLFTLFGVAGLIEKAWLNWEKRKARKANFRTIENILGSIKEWE